MKASFVLKRHSERAWDADEVTVSDFGADANDRAFLRVKGHDATTE
jgi:hypothetical protein